MMKKHPTALLRPGLRDPVWRGSIISGFLAVIFFCKAKNDRMTGQVRTASESHLLRW